MQKIYLFNPDHDLALAQGGDHYVAPPHARQLQHDLAALPLWYADEGSLLVVPDVEAKSWVNDMQSRVMAILPQEIKSHAIATFFPWGWNRVERKRLIRLGAQPESLPAERVLDHLRQLSHRRTTILIHHELEQRLEKKFSPVPVEVDTLQAVLDFASRHPGCYVKTPWSGSGKGVYHVVDATDPYFRNWCNGALKRQGSLMCETGLDKTADLAMEFYCNGSDVDFVGYSVFSTDFHSQYSHGLVETTSNLSKLIKKQCPAIDDIKACLVEILGTIIDPGYLGHVGIDMILYRDDRGDIKLDPCVEMNLRTTMGVVSSAVGMMMGKRGQFSIAHSSTGFHGGEVANRLYLTPVFSDTKYCAYIDFNTE